MHDDATRDAPAVSAGNGWLPEPGTVIADRYRLEHVIGRGGMGAVVAGQHIALDDRVAVKFLNPELARDAESIERFVREAKAAARIKSAHVVRVLDVGSTPEGLHYIVMDLLEGRDLEKVVAEGPLSIELAADCVLQAAEALAEAHSVGIVHRDIKPANLWLTVGRDGSPHVRVLDFGISKLTAPTTGATGAITDTQSVFGSPTYMSPEQIRSSKHVDPRTDVWALGVVLYELLTGAPPFVAETVAGVIAAISSDAPVPVRERRPDVPADLERVILACLEKDPARRATLADLAQGLAPFASAVGRASAERVARAAPYQSILPPRPSMPARSESELIGLSTTQASLDRVPSRRSPRAFWAAAGFSMTVALLAFAIVVATRTTGPAPASAPTTTTATPLAEQAPPSVTATSEPAPEPPPAEPTATAAVTPSAAPSATASAPRPRLVPKAPPRATSSGGASDLPLSKDRK